MLLFYISLQVCTVCACLLFHLFACYWMVSKDNSTRWVDFKLFCLICISKSPRLLSETTSIRHVFLIKYISVIYSRLFESWCSMTLITRVTEKKWITPACSGAPLSTGAAPILFQTEVIVTPSEGWRDEWSDQRTEPFSATLFDNGLLLPG